jgi:predicted amidophosphoribosyltransferase
MAEFIKLVNFKKKLSNEPKKCAKCGNKVDGKSVYCKNCEKKRQAKYRSQKSYFPF